MVMRVWGYSYENVMKKESQNNDIVNDTISPVSQAHYRCQKEEMQSWWKGSPSSIDNGPTSFTATKRRQRTTEKVDLNLTFHFHYNSIRANYIPDKDDNIVCEYWPKIDPPVVSAGQQSHTLLLQRTMENVNNFLKYLSRCACHSHRMNLQCRPNSCQGKGAKKRGKN